MELLEERWAKDAYATVTDIRTEGNELLDNAQLMYEDSISYQRTYAPLVHAEAEKYFHADAVLPAAAGVAGAMVGQDTQAEDVAVTWEITRSDRVKAFFTLEDDRLSGNISAGGELKVFEKVPRAWLRSPQSHHVNAAQQPPVSTGQGVDTVRVNWHACLWVVAVNKLLRRLKVQLVVFLRFSLYKDGPWDNATLKFNVQCLWNPIARDRMIKAVTRFASDERSICPYLHDLILGKLQAPAKTGVEVPASVSAPNLPPLNHSQIEAVTYALQHKLCLIQGPPGTGKTLTAATLVFQLWATKAKGSGILVSASSNTAVDNLAERIHLTGLKVVRVYSRQREGADAAAGSSAVPLEHLALHKLAETAPTTNSRTELFLRYSGDRRISDFNFKSVVIDESTQATEPETLVPLVLGADHNGVTSGQRQFPFSPGPPFKWPCESFPSFFYHCTTDEELSSTGTSYLNRGEASFVERLVMALIKRGATPSQIGVITPYIGQRNFLKTLLQRHPLPADVELSSVDAFQGREKDIIIFSCVRSNAQSSIGFLSDPRRLNVALTRARFCLFICGNADLLSLSRFRPPKRRGGSSREGEMQGPLNVQKEGEAAGPCELLRLAEAQFVGFCDVWPLLVKHYCKVDSIVTGPIYNLRPVAIHGRRSRDVAASRRTVVGNSGDVPGLPDASGGTGRATRPFNASGVPDYPLSSQEADQVSTGVAAVDDEEFSGSRFDI
ncbi:hypothetical protein Emag_000070 [Eimeria magna]